MYYQKKEPNGYIKNVIHGERRIQQKTNPQTEVVDTSRDKNIISEYLIQDPSKHTMTYIQSNHIANASED
jgi:hypothetical protein